MRPLAQDPACGLARLHTDAPSKMEGGTRQSATLFLGSHRHDMYEVRQAASGVRWSSKRAVERDRPKAMYQWLRATDRHPTATAPRQRIAIWRDSKACNGANEPCTCWYKAECATLCDYTETVRVG